MTDTKEEPFLSPAADYWDSIDANECGFILRILEREAFTHVVTALRAKGPPSEYTFILLDHLKSALSINDELGRAEIRKAAFDPKLSKISSMLNPNYDTCSEWAGCSYVSRGAVEAGPSRGKPFANTNSTSIADQLLCLATTNNKKVDRSNGKAFELLGLPPKPFVPERLRMLLRETNRPEERIPLPLEVAPVPAPVKVKERPPIRTEMKIIKKRKQRRIKAVLMKPKAKIALPAKRQKGETRPSTSETASSSTAVPTPAAPPSSTPVTPAPVAPATPLSVIAAAANLSAVVASLGDALSSPGQPPQSGDAMKTWVSKIHELAASQMAANAAKNGGILVPPDETAVPSTSTPSTEESLKKKRRPRTTPVQDPIYLNSCARTRPFQFESAAPGKTKPLRGNPDKKSSAKYSSPVVYGSASSAHSATATPLARPSVTDMHMEHGRNGAGEAAIAATFAKENSMGGSGVERERASGSRPTTVTPQHPNTQLKRPIVAANLSRTPAKYFVNNSGVAVGQNAHSTSNSLRTPSNPGGIGGRTASLGSQQLSAVHGSGFQLLLPQKASPSASNSSIGSAGGSMGSAIGASSSSSSILHPPDAIQPPEGHDYGAPVPPPSVQSNIGVYGGVRDPTGGLRLMPRIPPRSRPTIRSPSVHTPPHMPPNGVSPSPVPIYATPMQRAGSVSSMRPRTGSRGAGPVGGIPSSAERVERLPPTASEVTDGMIQATVDTIKREAAQKECANGKRATVPRELLERENGSFSMRQSPAPRTPSHAASSSLQSTQPYPVCRPSMTSSEGPAAPSTSALGGTGVDRRPMPSSLPKSTLSTAHPTSPLAPLAPTTTITNSISSPISSAPLNPINSTIRAHLESRGASSVLADSPNATSSSQLQPRPSSLLMNSCIPDPVYNERMQQILSMGTRPRVGEEPMEAAISAAVDRVLNQKPAQKLYMLQPEKMSYAEYKPNNPSSFKSFASDGTPVQFPVSKEELYDQGLLARPSSSGIGGEESGVGRRGTTIPGFPDMDSYLQGSLAVLNNLTHPNGISPSLSIPSTAGTALNSNGDMPSTSRDGKLDPSTPQLHLPTPSTAATPSEGKTASDVQDILAESCRELR